MLKHDIPCGLESLKLYSQMQGDAIRGHRKFKNFPLRGNPAVGIFQFIAACIHARPVFLLYPKTLLFIPFLISSITKPLSIIIVSLLLLQFDPKKINPKINIL